MTHKGMFRNLAAVLILITIVSCNRVNNAGTGDDQFVSGSYTFVFDETVAPILDQELFVYKSLFPKADPQIIYKPENKILNLILNDKARFAVMGRNLKPDETRLLVDRNLPPKVGKVAEDAVTLIVNKQSADSLMLLSEVKALFTNGNAKSIPIVFDNQNSSVLNYLKRFFGVENLKQKNIYALKNSKEVIKYISEHNNVIGFLSYSWLIEPDADYANTVNKINIVGLKDDLHTGKNSSYIKPNQTSFALKEYPLIRTIYVVDCTGKVGLGAGFSAFLQSERGQKIVLRSGLLPDSMPRRDINIK